MPWTEVPDRAAGYAPVVSDWDTYIRDNFNAGTWQAIEVDERTSTAGNLAFGTPTPIRQIFTHLMIVGSVRSASAGFSDGIYMRFNGAITNYDQQNVNVNAGSVTGTQAFAGSSLQIGECAAASAAAGYFSSFVVIIPRYASGSYQKNSISRCVSYLGTTTTFIRVMHAAGFWRSTSNITQIDIGIGAANFAVGSRATLYGM